MERALLQPRFNGASSTQCKAQMLGAPSFRSPVLALVKLPNGRLTSRRLDFIPRRNTSLRVSASLPVQAAVNSASTLFTATTILVMPFYTIMILAPRKAWTKRVMESSIPHVILGLAYTYLLSLAWTPNTLHYMFASKYYFPELAGITQMFSSTLTVASAWVHLLAADLFVGRQVYLEGLEHNVETRHSLILCLMFCPIGMVCHIITKAITLGNRLHKVQVE